MFIKTTSHVNARTLDGRVYAAGEGTVTHFDDHDEGMVGLAEALVASGQAELYDDTGTVEGDEDVEEVTVAEPTGLPAGDYVYDPGEHTVADVNEYLSTASAEEQTRVLDAEASGKARKGLVGDAE